jgi:DNA-binding PadR family transcriptional regulator
MTGVIDRLVKTGLVVRSRSETDRRVVLVEATPAGVQTFEQIKARMVQEGVEGFDIFTVDELASLEKLFSHFLRTELARQRAYETDELDRHLRKVESFLDTPMSYAEEGVPQLKPCEASD